MGPPTKFDPSLTPEVVKRHRLGESSTYIRERLGISEYQLVQHLRAAGLSRTKSDMERYEPVLVLIRQGLTNVEIAAAMNWSDNHAQRVVQLARKWAKSRGEDLPPPSIGGRPPKVSDAEIVEKLVPIDEAVATAEKDSEKQPASFWAFVVNRCIESYSREAISNYMGIAYDTLTVWGHGHQAPSAKHQAVLWQILCAAVLFDKSMDKIDIEDLHDTLSERTSQKHGEFWRRRR